ncbi:MAG: hypothetical protein GYB53_17265 [Rhodobacteraceae bacterium]|nr:hypothetical protein [Paracoccaceae bacterium]MBR9819469.1 hypothetical protein [Paracoccaceae bacterium]
MSNDLCRTVGLALGAALALVLLVALTGPLGFLGALVVALALGGALIVGLNRFVCVGAAGQGPVQASGRETREAVTAPAGEMQPQGAAPAAEVAAAPEDAPGDASGEAEAGAEEAAVAPAAAAEAEETMVSGDDDAPADDLKRLKGVGPKLAEALEAAGIRSFAQIAAWTEADVTWVEENVKGARGRIGRDGWIAQAQDLVAADAGAE